MNCNGAAVGATLKFLPGICLRLPITDINHLLREDGKPDLRVQDRESEIKTPSTTPSSARSGIYQVPMRAAWIEQLSG